MDKAYLVGFDLDGVICNTYVNLFQLYFNVTGKQLNISEITTYNMYHCFDKSVAEVLMSLFGHEDLYKGACVFSEVFNAFHSMLHYSNVSNIIYTWNATSKIGANKLNDFVIPMCGDADYLYIQTMGGSSKVALPFDIVIEDSISNLLEYSDTTHKILMTRPWNISREDYDLCVKNNIYRTHTAKVMSMYGLNDAELIKLINSLDKGLMPLLRKLTGNIHMRGCQYGNG